MGEEPGAVDFAGLGLEHVDKRRADDFALGLRVVDPVQPAKEQLAGVVVDQRNVVMAAKQAHDLLGLSPAAAAAHSSCR